MHGEMAVATMAAGESTDRRHLIMSDTESRVLDTLAAMNLTSLEQSRDGRRHRRTPADQASGVSPGWAAANRNACAHGGCCSPRIRQAHPVMEESR
jgi:hypothetical protein